MTSPIQSIIQAGSKVWLDSVDPGSLDQQMEWGISGATSNPVIIHDIIKSGEAEKRLEQLFSKDLSTEEIAWKMTDHLVMSAQERFHSIWESTEGNDGYVSFELDPLLEDPEQNLPIQQRVEQYVELGKKWSSDHHNRMIKVPNTNAGLAALEPLAAAGVNVNVTLTFTEQQYVQARNAIWRGAQQRSSLDHLKSVHSIFVSRVDVYANKHVTQLSSDAQRQVGIVNAKKIWEMNQKFWRDKNLRLDQEIVFASTGPKLEGDAPWKYVEAFTGSGIITNPPEVNETVQNSGRTFSRQVDQYPSEKILDEIQEKVDPEPMQKVLMEEGLDKFAKPQKALLKLIEEKRPEYSTR